VPSCPLAPADKFSESRPHVCWHLTDDVALGRNLVRNLAYMRPRAMVLRDPP
jgi:hypothetical protein